ncbi:MAG: DNA-directed RNA polymerase subunit beta' [Ruminococcaceae bacterium]|nr:DNA-directed RNA polymerase subunit beta' [Oscillospiraceae bacterium]
MANNEFASIKIGLASPDMIREWSYGEVTKAETINYRSLKAETGGLFCERIFGPTKDGACMCGKYKNSHVSSLSKDRVHKCDKCGVEITTKKVRRERMGHIELACPVSHIWYFKAIPSRMALVLDEISPKQLEKVLYFAENVVLDPGITPLKKGTVLSEAAYAEYREMYGNEFRVGMGAEAIKELLASIDIEELSKQLKAELQISSGQKKGRIIKRLEVVEAFRKSGNRLDWMILDVLPVLPPDIRPMTQLDGGRFASCDLNELYRRVIVRNNRLKKLMEIHTPEIVVRNEKRMLQEAVDALIDNGRHGKPVTGPSNRQLKSLSEMLRGKQGRFRQNLLGKRVDYSGRSVIVVGPNLKIYQCGLPREMALELFKPFVVKRLTEMMKATNIKEAQKKIERAYQHPEVWDALENVIKEHPVLLNRAPTLHRLSIQAFEPVLVEGRAIKLHPLVCSAFNADFDGDQMPVHVPLSAEAQAEARFLMLSANNLLKPADGRAVAVPTQDMILGTYYLLMEKPGEPGEGMCFRDMNEANMAYVNGTLGLHAPVKIRLSKEINGQTVTGMVETSLGCLLFNQNIPQDLGFVDRSKPENALKMEIDTAFLKKNKGNVKKILGMLIDSCIKYHSAAECSEMLDNIKEMGYQYSTRASFSISVYDMTIPPEKKSIIDDAQARVDSINNYFKKGLLTDEERYNSVIKIWASTTDEVTAKMMACFHDLNPIKIMADSGARGSTKQMRQLAAMRGSMFATNGKTMEIPIKSNFREGMKILEYFMGSRSSRKSLSDTALRTADSGYLTRRLVDVSQEVIVREECCDATEGQVVREISNPQTPGSPLESLAERIIGRYSFGPVVDAQGNEIVPADTMITEEHYKAIEAAGIKEVEIRTLLKCHARQGICAHCYGADLASSGKPVSVGEAVGIIAAQSIGEPGTQLTMRTFHSGGVAGADITQGLPRVEELFEARAPKKSALICEQTGKVLSVAHGDNVLVHEVSVVDDETGEMHKYTVPYGMQIVVREGDHVERGQVLTEGSKAPADIMRISGLNKVYEYILEEIQHAYRSQGVSVNDKHIEIIARQMTRKVYVEDPGDTDLLIGTVMDVLDFEEVNNAIKERIAAGENLREASAKRLLMGITKAALQTESFLSAASFQETTKVLTEAAIKGKIDHLLGLKENVIIGKLIPAGTGMSCYHNVHVEKTGAAEIE